MGTETNLSLYGNKNAYDIKCLEKLLTKAIEILQESNSRKMTPSRQISSSGSFLFFSALFWFSLVIYVFFHNLPNLSMFTSKYERSNVEVVSIVNCFCKHKLEARWCCVSNAGSIKWMFHIVAFISKWHPDKTIDKFCQVKVRKQLN